MKNQNPKLNQWMQFVLSSVFVTMFVSAPAAWAAPVGTAFTYQGHLERPPGTPVDDTCSCRFGLWDAAVGGSQKGNSPQTISGVVVASGSFTVAVDFGDGAFDGGTARWLEIAVQCPGDLVYILLSPRVEITPAPHALALPGLYTKDNPISPNVIGGFSGNIVAAGVEGATIAGGGDSISATRRNRVFDHYGVVSGGIANTAGDDDEDGDPTTSQWATVGGGQGNRAGAENATVGGGFYNTALNYNAAVGGGRQNEAIGVDSTVGGGFLNEASGGKATVGGGSENKAIGSYATVGGGTINTAGGHKSTVSGGTENTAADESTTIGGGFWNEAMGRYASIGGGVVNTTLGEATTIGGGNGNFASALWATISGGGSNLATGSSATIAGGAYNSASESFAAVGGGVQQWAQGFASTIPGGSSNVAGGDYSLAAGRRAIIRSQFQSQTTGGDMGTFVWADSTNADFISDGSNRFLVRASGGSAIYSSSNLSSGVSLAAGSGSWSSVSDRNLKENVEPVDKHDVLERLSRIPIAKWNYKSQDPSIRHMGPMGQDFYEAFGLGEEPQRISTIDADGVTLAAIQGLYEILQEKNRDISEIKDRNLELLRLNAELEARLTTVESVVAQMNE